MLYKLYTFKTTNDEGFSYTETVLAIEYGEAFIAISNKVRNRNPSVKQITYLYTDPLPASLKAIDLILQNRTECK